MRKNLFDEEEETTQFQNDDEEFWNQYIQYKKNDKNFSGHYDESAADATEHELTEEEMEKELESFGELSIELTGIDENLLSLAYSKAEQVLLNEQKLQKIVENATQAITNAVDNKIEPEIARNIALDALRMLIDEAKI